MSYYVCEPVYIRHLAAKIFISYAATLKDDEADSQDEITYYDVTSFNNKDPLTRKNLYLKALNINSYLE
ncbi:MAG: hypothetical protein QRY72_00425 [Candidatus Rhabdochlamydia sp.]